MKETINLQTTLDDHKIPYRQLTKTKLELYLRSPHYDKVIFYPKSGKLKGLSWNAEITKKVVTREELIETVRSVERGFELTIEQN